MIEIAQASITAAADKMLQAALVGDGWRQALSAFAEAAGARGAVLIGELATDLPQGEIKMAMLATPSIADHIADYLAGDMPPDPRISRVRPSRGGGFLADFGSFRPEEVARNPYYLEHLRPYGLGWHACAFLNDWSSNHSLYLNLKRDYRHGHYAPGDISLIDAALPTLRTAAAISHLRLNAETRGYSQALGASGAGVFALDAIGCAVPLNETAARSANGGLALVRGRLTARTPDDQRRLERAVAAALRQPAVAGFTALGSGAPAHRLVVRTVPVPGDARDIFGAALALVIVETRGHPDAPSPRFVSALRDAFEMTRMEANVAALVAVGVSPVHAARSLGIAEGTARKHLKSAMTKAGVHRQAELAAFVARMRP